ncbi:MAG: pilus assembly protein PilM [bacterium]
MEVAPLEYRLGLEISPRWLKMAQLASDNSIRPFVYLLPLEAKSFHEQGYIYKHLKEIVKSQRNDIHTKDVSVCISDICSLSKIISVEKDESNVKDVIEWEFEQQILGTLQEYYYDFYPVKILDTEIAKHFIAVAVRKTLLDSILMEIRNAKLNPVVLDMEYCAIVNMFEHLYPEENENLVAIVDISFSCIKYFLVYNGVFSDYNIEMHAQGFGENFNITDLYIGKLCVFLESRLKEIAGSNVFFEKKEISRIYLTGDLFFKNPEISNFIKSHFSITAKYLNPFRHTELAGEDFSVICSVPVGLTLRSAGD